MELPALRPVELEALVRPTPTPTPMPTPTPTLPLLLARSSLDVVAVVVDPCLAKSWSMPPIPSWPL